MALFCPRCREQVRAEDVNLQTQLAKCRVCHEVFSFDLPKRPLDNMIIPGPTRVPKPNSLRVEDDGEVRRIVQSWFTPAIIPLLLFCIVWDTFLVVWYAFALFGEDQGDGVGWWLALLFPLFHVAIGVGLTYLVLAGLLNRTIVTVTADRLTVRHGPIPTGGNRSLEISEIAQIYCEENKKHTRRGVTFFYRVMAMTKDAEAVKLVGHISDKSTALFYEQQLEEWLGIPQRHVPGEVER